MKMFSSPGVFTGVLMNGSLECHHDQVTDLGSQSSGVPFSLWVTMTQVGGLRWGHVWQMLPLPGDPNRQDPGWAVRPWAPHYLRKLLTPGLSQAKRWAQAVHLTHDAAILPHWWTCVFVNMEVSGLLVQILWTGRWLRNLHFKKHQDGSDAGVCPLREIQP